MMSSLNQTVTHEERFWCYFTETRVHKTHVWSGTPSQPVFVLFLYMILHAKQTFFINICIAVADPIIKKAEGCRVPDKLRICVFYAMKKSKNACIIRSECTHTYCCVSKLSKFGTYLYSRVHNNTFLSLRNSPQLLPFIFFEGESAYIRGVPKACLSKHRCQKRSDWMFTINHPIVVLRNK